MPRLLIVVCTISAFFSAQQAKSANVDLVGLSPKDAASAGAMRADADRSYAAYSNPALLSEPGETSGLGIVYINWDLKDLSQGDQVDEQQPLPKDPYNESKAKGFEAVSFGYKKYLAYGFGVGIAGLMPKEVVEIHGDSGREINYLQYQLRHRRPEVFLGLGYDIGYGLAVGYGVMGTLAMNANMQAGLSNTTSQGRLHITTEPITVPFWGLSYRKNLSTFGALSLSATHRNAHKSDMNVETEIVAKTDSFILPSAIGTSLTAFYDPAVTNVSASFATGRVSIALGAERTSWPKYAPTTINLSGEDIATLTEGQITASAPTVRDSLTYRLGSSYALVSVPELSLRAGIERRERADIRHTGAAYVVDTDRTTYALGADYGLVTKDKGRFDLAISLLQSNLAPVDVATSTGSFQAGGRIRTFMGGLTHGF